MMDKDKQTYNEDKLRELLQETKLSPSENLKYRIMHQIEAEQALAPKVVKSTKPLLHSILSIAVVLYILLVVLIVGVCVTDGVEALSSATFAVPAIIISGACSVFGLITVLDEKRLSKK